MSLLTKFLRGRLAAYVFRNNFSIPASYFGFKSGSTGSEDTIRLKYYTIGALGLSLYITYKTKQKIAFAETAEKITPVDNLPLYKKSDVAQHSTKENRIWVTYKDSVYDITDFVDQHPGGNKILLAAGKSVDPFWKLYGVHNTSEVTEILEEYKIGRLLVEESETKDKDDGDPYSNDPERHVVLIPASVKPYNAEPPSSLLADNFYTPNDIFYVRNHLPVPVVDVKKFRLEVTGIGIKTKQLTLSDIKKLPAYEVSAAVQCAGNRRSEMTQIKPVKGLSWKQAAIGNAKWKGARLVDVLQMCGWKNDKGASHVQFEGLDMGPDNVCYGASIPIEKALDPRGDVLLCYEMNGEPLPADHGYPLRVIVPGVVGARNVKWLSKVILSKDESTSHWQQNDYKGFSPSVDWHNVDFKNSPAIQELPVNSAICSPAEGETVHLEGDKIPIKGYAWSGGGKSIVRVDVSCDQGETWHTATLDQEKDKAPYHWAWTLWSISVPVSSTNLEKVEIWVKAVDSSYNTQPESFKNIWNLRGVLCNAYHKITVNVKA